MATKGLLFSILAGLLAAGLIGGGSKRARAEQDASRRTMIHERAPLVMPFDLDKTVHVFERTPEGGVQQVRAKDPADEKEIYSIREHLKEEAERFARADFSDPARLHGHDMPGLDVLRRSAGKLTVAYRDLSDGGEIVYDTRDPEVLAAVHQWFGAQLHDHGPDATDHRAH